MFSPSFILALVWTVAEITLITGVNHKVGTEIEAAATFRSVPLQVSDRPRLLRTATLIGYSDNVEDEAQQAPRATTTTPRRVDWSQRAANRQKCDCYGCLTPTGECMYYLDFPDFGGYECDRLKGVSCGLKDADRIWGVTFDDRCESLLVRNYSKGTMLTLQVRLYALPNFKVNFGRAVQMTDMDTGELSIGAFPCSSQLPQNVSQVLGTSVTVQGYFEDRSQNVKSIMSEQNIPPSFKENGSYFVIMNLQEADSVAEGFQGFAASGASMAGALRANWSPQMTFAVAVVSEGLNTSPDQSTSKRMKKLFFTDFVGALSAASLGKISVSGDVINVTISFPDWKDESDRYQKILDKVNEQLISNPVWTSSMYKAFIVPKGWSPYGGAEKPGRVSFFSDIAALDVSNLMHEIGHNMGLDHAGILPWNTPSGYDDEGDCSSAMSKCLSSVSYSLPSNWFLGFNTVQQTIRADALTTPISVRITSHLQNESSGVLLLQKSATTGEYIPAYTISYIRKKDVSVLKSHDRKFQMDNWVGKVYVHKLPVSAYGQARAVAMLSSPCTTDRIHSTTYRIRSLSMAVSVAALDDDTATVAFCKANSFQQAKACSST